jgi:hypothetical protein
MRFLRRFLIRLLNFATRQSADQLGLLVTREENPELTINFAKPTWALDYNCAHDGNSPWN